MKRPENQIIVIFGATGDLTKRKLIPALHALEKQKIMPEKYAIIGIGRKDYNDETFRTFISDNIYKYADIDLNNDSDAFINKIHYLSLDPLDTNAISILSTKIDEIANNLKIRKNVVFYLSTPPSLYGVIPKNLAINTLNCEESGWKRVIIEKPFGYDLKSAIELNSVLMSDWNEKQIYRIDHYLGKETVQNVLVTRFSNGIFEPLWNRNYIHHVEITSVEDIGVENRGGYYEGSGAMRDMVQNHLLQLVGLIAMEPPASLDSDSIRNETVKVFQSFRHLKEEEIKTSTIRGQYLASIVKGQKLRGYREEEGVSPDSKTETYAALKFYIDNWRWGGVPFYIRTGKRMPTKVTEAVIHFKPTPHYLFNRKSMLDSNQLIIRIQPDEGILLKFGMKVPGAGFDVQTVNMDFHYSDLAHQRIPTAYERLLLDCMNGDSTLYARGDSVMKAWKFLDPVVDAWKNNSNVPIHGYPAGSWGPEMADSLIEGENMTWRYPCKNLSEDGIYCEL